MSINYNNKKTFINTDVFPIYFFYRSQGEGNKKEPDKMLAFDRREERDKVMKAIQDLCEV